MNKLIISGAIAAGMIFSAIAPALAQVQAVVPGATSAIKTPSQAIPTIKKLSEKEKEDSDRAEKERELKQKFGLASTAKTIGATDRACAISIIERRDNAILAALDAYHAAVRQLLQNRTIAVKAAWQLENTSDIRHAIKAASNAYRTGVVRARNDFRDARRIAWDAARKAIVKECHAKSGDIGDPSGDDKL